METKAALLAFNRGLVSRLGLARADVKRVASFSAEEMINFLPRVLGSMSIRPGWKYLGATNGNLASKLIPFVFSVDDTALIEISADTLRVWRNDAIITRGTVGTGITNGTFTTDLTGWTDTDELGATSSWLTGGYMQLLGDGTNSAIRDQAVTVSGGDSSVEHALRITITKGPVTFSAGSSIGSDNYIAQTSLGTGTHSLTLTPSGSFWVRFASRLSRPVLIDSISVESAGVMTITSPWSADDLDNLRWDQSGDIVFVACEGQQQYQIERRSTTSWSVVKYEPEDGPFRIENTGPITLTPSALTGSITVTASKGLFRSSHVGALFSITSEGQQVTSDLSSAGSTNAIRITGVDSSRVFTIVLSGTWTGTVNLERSLDSEDGPWETVSTVSWTANTTETYDDGLDNQIAWYRLTFTPGTGTVTAHLDYALGSITGVVRVTAYTSSVSVSADVLSDLGGVDATDVWAEGAWSDFRGWPTAVALHEGRLWWAGKSKVWGSVTDAYDSFSPDVEGDSGSISRSLGVGPVDRINWLFSSNRLLMGGDLNEYAARSSSLDEPLTPTNFNVKATSSQGSSVVTPGRIDSNVVFANRTGMKVFENSQQQVASEYTVTDLCQLVPEIGDPGITRIVTQRQPDTRIHAIRSDGTVALAIFDKLEDVLGWCEIETDGEVEDAAVLPAQSGTTDDYVYYIVKRNINGSDVRYLEKWSQANEGIGGLGTGGTGSPFQDFSAGEVAPSDNTAQFNVHVSASTGNIYVPGPASDALWVYNPATFPAYTQISSGANPIRNVGIGGSMRQDGEYFILSGDSGYPVRAVALDSGTVTNLGSNSDTVVLGANDTYMIVSESGGGKSYSYSIASGTRTLDQTFGVALFSSVTNNGVWDATGAFWIVNNAWDLIRVKPGVSGYTSFTPPIATGAGVQLSAQVVYDAERNRLIMGFSDNTIRAFSNWTVGVNNSGTWTTLKTGYGSTGLVLETDTDTLFVSNGSSYVYRFYVPTMGLVDQVRIQDLTPDTTADIDYDLQPCRQIVYVDGAAYTQVRKDSVYYLLKIAFAGDPILFDSDGNSLQSGGTVGRLNALADSFIEYTGAQTTTITGLDHLESETVVVWANGVDLGTDENYEQTYVVASGSITLPAATSNVTVGLPYSATWKSAKLGLQGARQELLFGKDKRIVDVAILLANTHAKGIRFGPDFDTLDDRSSRDGWADVDPDNIDTDYDSEPMTFPGGWNTDTRLCLKAQAPRPCTVLAINITLEV